MANVSDARRELARRKLARERFLDCASYLYQGYPSQAPHLALLGEYLEQVERYIDTGGREGIGRLMVFMPPRHWKSTTSSVLFPVWMLGRHPEISVGVASYNASLATGFSRRARNHIGGEYFRALFGDLSAVDVQVALSDDSRSVEHWNVSGHKGGMTAAGVGGGWTGRGFQLMIVDDPHKDRIEAESASKREAIWQWWTSAARTRVEPGGAMVVIQTRWHSDDLSGRLIREMIETPDADEWEILCLPAVAEDWAAAVDPEQVRKALKDGWFMSVDPLGRAPGEALWPETFDLDYFAPIRANSGYDWDSLYQQRPRALEGKLIQANDILTVRADQVPADVRWVRYWDLAVSGRESADWIAGVKCGLDRERRFYIGDVRRIKGPWASARTQMLRVMRDDSMAVVQGIEVSGQQGGYYQEMKRDLAMVGRSIVAVAPRGDKTARAQLWATRIPDRMVYMVKSPWNEDFVAEALSFPGGRHDDQVDGVSGAWQMLTAGWKQPSSYQG